MHKIKHPSLETLLQNLPSVNTNTHCWQNRGWRRTIYLYMALQPFIGPWPSSFLIFYTVGRTPWTGDQPDAGQLPAHRTAQKQNKHTQTSMPQVGFDPTFPVLERAKRVHAFFFIIIIIGVGLTSPGTAATSGLLYSPR
jgi:hypothetical protein